MSLSLPSITFQYTSAWPPPLPHCWNCLVTSVLSNPKDNFQQSLTQLTIFSVLEHSLCGFGKHALLVFLLSLWSPTTYLLYLTSQCWSSRVPEATVLVLTPPFPLLSFFSPHVIVPHGSPVPCYTQLVACICTVFLASVGIWVCDHSLRLYIAVIYVNISLYSLIVCSLRVGSASALFPTMPRKVHWE